jgi:hypothetical protein
MGPIMTFHKILRIPKHPPRADKSALGTINRPLRPSFCFLEWSLYQYLQKLAHNCHRKGVYDYSNQGWRIDTVAVVG